MASPLILITGATGFIGSHTALGALESNYRLRVSIRQGHQEKFLRRVFCKHENRVEFILIPDLTVSGCFDDALKDVDYVLHLAAPISGNEGSSLDPATRGTISLLDSAMRCTRIKKIILMQSVLSFIPLGGLKDGVVVTENKNIDLSIDPSRIDPQDMMTSYHASKLAAYQSTLDFIRSKNPSYSVITIHPVYVYGRSLLQTADKDISGTNAMLFSTLAAGQPSSSLYVGQYLGVHVSDVVDAQMAVLANPRVGNGSAFLLCGGRRSWEDVHEFVKREYPSFEIKLEPRSWLDLTVNVDKAEQELGLRFRPMEDQVRDVVEQQLGFLHRD